MKFYRLAYILLCFFLISSCKTEHYSAKIEEKRIAIDSDIQQDTSITNFIQPYKEHINSVLDSALAYNPSNLSTSDGDLNTAIGNLMADIVLEQANPVFRQRTGHNIDAVLLNYGGIRSTLNKGKVTARSAYALMPFENEIVVAQLTGAKMKEMLQYLEDAGTAHPVSGIKIKMNDNYKIVEATIDGKPIDTSKTYFVATSDYLQQGGDNMAFFNNPEKLYNVDYKLRNAIIDYFRKVDTIEAKVDNRFIRIKDL
ncbi:5'-nucleotidase [Zunongwangia sp. F363]|uniref:5'-nucleotidase n=1 Tax=Autumnicola tepida TaxID=3075595 RepID=A0ABU3CDE4_9FLAO|nr:5'-nucleotidase [Zunongwangia sp. F363]MDT0644361.1 5'-nucleotidase [Zunongwangia sp. F363]